MYRNTFDCGSCERDLKTEGFGFVVEGTMDIEDNIQCYVNVGLGFPVEFYVDNETENSDNMILLARAGVSYEILDTTSVSVSTGGGVSFDWADIQNNAASSYDYANYAIGVHARLALEYSLSCHFSLSAYVVPDMHVYQISHLEQGSLSDTEGSFRLGFNGTASVGVSYSF